MTSFQVRSVGCADLVARKAPKNSVVAVLAAVVVPVLAAFGRGLAKPNKSEETNLRPSPKQGEKQEEQQATEAKREEARQARQARKTRMAIA